jgi:hypothetical protein
MEANNPEKTITLAPPQAEAGSTCCWIQDWELGRSWVSRWWSLNKDCGRSWILWSQPGARTRQPVLQLLPHPCTVTRDKFLHMFKLQFLHLYKMVLVVILEPLTEVICLNHAKYNIWRISNRVIINTQWIPNLGISSGLGLTELQDWQGETWIKKLA